MIDLEKRRRVMSRSLQLGHCICNPKQPCPCEIFKQKDVCLCAGEKLPEAEEEIRLTQLVENTGCASKINQDDLQQVLSGLPEVNDPRVLVGARAADDAGIFSLEPEKALVQTVDVFTPNVDDPYIFGQIAAANSVSDIYAMGGQPLTALSIVSFPSDRLPLKIMQAMLKGGMDKLAEAGTVVLGGHSIKDETIKFGFAVTGIIDPKRIITNNAAKPGDVLILTKPLGTGVLSFAHQLGRAPEEGLQAAIEAMTQLNRAAAEVMTISNLKAATDITGFGLLGHLSEMVKQSRVTALIEADLVPSFPGVIDCLRQGIISGAAERNREYAAAFIEKENDLPEELLYLLCDPQTSGGLLMAVPTEKVSQVLTALEERSVKGVIIGKILSPSEGRIIVRISKQKIISATEAAMTQTKAKPSRLSSACCPSGPPADLIEKTAEEKEEGVKKKEETTKIGSKATDKAGKEETQAELLSAILDLEKTASAEKFISFIEEVATAGVLSLREKELVSLALAVQARCEPCLTAHLNKALAAGLTPKEIKEALWLGVVFGGSPALMFIEALKEKLGL